MYSEIRDLCRKTYQETIKAMEIPVELKRSLKVHERVPLFIENIARDLALSKKTLKRETIIQATRDMTRMFVGLVERKAKEGLMSTLAKRALKTEVEKKLQFQKNLDALEGLGTKSVTQTKKGVVEKQTIDVDKNLDQVKEILET